jgi:hypothetical protein
MDDHNSKSDPLFNWLLAATFLIVVAFAVIAAPNFFGSHGHDCYAYRCALNLRQIDGAIQQWALEHSRTNGPVTWSDLKPYLGRGPEGSLEGLFCAEDKTHECTNSYLLGDVTERPRCRLKPADPKHRLE